MKSTEQKTIACSNCGSKNQADAVFCTSCGTKVAPNKGSHDCGTQ